MRNQRLYGEYADAEWEQPFEFLFSYMVVCCNYQAMHVLIKWLVEWVVEQETIDKWI